MTKSATISNNFHNKTGYSISISITYLRSSCFIALGKYRCEVKNDWKDNICDTDGQNAR